MYGLSFIGYRAQIIMGPLARSGCRSFCPNSLWIHNVLETYVS